MKKMSKEGMTMMFSSEWEDWYQLVGWKISEGNSGKFKQKGKSRVESWTTDRNEELNNYVLGRIALRIETADN